jgi:hypothetical protein
MLDLGPLKLQHAKLCFFRSPIVCPAGKMQVWYLVINCAGKCNFGTCVFSYASMILNLAPIVTEISFTACHRPYCVICLSFEIVETR